MLIVSSFALAAALAQAPPPSAVSGEQAPPERPLYAPPPPPVPPSPPPPPLPHPAYPAHLIAGSITAADYPVAALRAEEEGAVRVRLEITTTGTVAKCTVLSSSGSVSLDFATCALMQERFRFTPARNARGRKVPDLAVTRMVWRIEREPETPTPPPPPG